MTGFQDFESFRQEQRAREAGEFREPAEVPAEPEVTPHKPQRRHRRILRRGADTPPPWYRNRTVYYLIVVVMLLILLALCFLPLPFGTVTLTGLQTLEEQDVYRVARISRPVNTLQLSTSDTERRLRGDLRIADVSVRREFPATVRIQIEERKAVAVAETEFGFAVFDRTGLVIAQAPVIYNTQAPVITGKKLGNTLLGDRLKDPTLLHALQYLAKLSPNGWNQISEVNISDPQQIVAYTRDDIPVRLGDGSQAEEQAGLSENMLRDIRLRKLDVLFIDANVGAPYIKLK
ncbi:MAG: FtsQ-type POTRA domain-containing protein [Veillonellaceae bacterium]|nr:FtsQ-type POTRA domain-containing protein [Veillonellaceae bacterium]